jgi:hypothetical protein
MSLPIVQVPKAYGTGSARVILLAAPPLYLVVGCTRRVAFFWQHPISEDLVSFSLLPKGESGFGMEVAVMNQAGTTDSAGYEIYSSS